MSDDIVDKANLISGSAVLPTISFGVLDAADAKQLQQALALPEIKALVDALYKSADGWDNVIGMGLIAKKHFGSAKVLRDEALDALRGVGLKL